MEKRLGVRKEDERQRKPLDPEQQLYVTPDELKVHLQAALSTGSRAGERLQLGQHA